MTDAARSTFVAIVKKKKTEGGSHTRHLDGVGMVLAVAAVLAVPLLTWRFPRPAQRLVLPLLAVTSIGVYATVPDTEHVRLTMLLAVVVAVACVATKFVPPPAVGAVIALIIVAAAITDCADQNAALARAIGCFGALVVAAPAEWINARRDASRRPTIAALAIIHCVVAVFSSRALIRQESTTLVVLAVAAVLTAALAVLVTASSAISAEP
jgi:hypothetical protein